MGKGEKVMLTGCYESQGIRVLRIFGGITFAAAILLVFMLSIFER